MATLVLIVLLAWLVTALAVLGLARLLGRLSTSRSAMTAPPDPQERPAPRTDNVVALLARPRNDLVRSDDERRRRAA